MSLAPFLLVFDEGKVPRQQVLDYLDLQPLIKHWYAIFSGAIIVVSDADTGQIADLIRTGFPQRQFVLSRISGASTDGWMNKEVWEFINRPRSSGHWPK